MFHSLLFFVTWQCLLTDRVFDFVLIIPWDAAWSRVDVGDLSNNALESREPSRAARNVSDRRDGYLARGTLQNGCITGKELIAIFHPEHEIARGASVAVGQVGRATRENLGNLEPVDGRGVIGKPDESVEQSHDMVGHIADIDILGYDVFAVFRGNLEGNLLLLLGKHISRQRNSQEKQCSQGGVAFS
jgi:hypothetical protein